jgi:hypothetical protein
MKTLLTVLAVVLVVLLIIGALQNVGNKNAPAPEFSTHLADTVALSHTVLATRTSDDAARMGDLIRAGDKSALEKMALQGRLTVVKVGATVTLTARDIFKSVEAFRERGNPDTQYTGIGEIR